MWESLSTIILSKLFQFVRFVKGTQKYYLPLFPSISFFYQDDLLVLPAPLAHNLSDINPLVLVKAVSAGVHVVDPLTGEVIPNS